MWSDFHSSLWVKISKYLDAGWSFDLPFTRSPFDTFTNTLYKYFKQNMQKWNIQKCQTDMWCCPTIVTLPPRAGYTSFQNHSLNPKQRPWIRFSSQISQDFLRTLLPCVLWPSLQLFLVGIVTIGFPRIVSYYLFAAIFIALPQDKKRLLVESTHMMYF